MKSVADAIVKLEKSIARLKKQLPSWDGKTESGARRHRQAAAKVLSLSRDLEQLVRKETFGYP